MSYTFEQIVETLQTIELTDDEHQQLTEVIRTRLASVKQQVHCSVLDCKKPPTCLKVSDDDKFLMTDAEYKRFDEILCDEHFEMTLSMSIICDAYPKYCKSVHYGDDEVDDDTTRIPGSRFCEQCTCHRCYIDYLNTGRIDNACILCRIHKN